MNSQLQQQIRELKHELSAAQQDPTGGWTHYLQTAVAKSNTFDDADHTELQQEVTGINQQPQQAQHAQQAVPDVSSLAADHLSQNAQEAAQQLKQVQSQLDEVQESAAAQHAQHEAETTGDITDLTSVNGQLMQQVAELQGQVGKAQREAQHMRELVKAQHAKREEHAESLQTELEQLQQDCQAKDAQVRTFLLTHLMHHRSMPRLWLSMLIMCRSLLHLACLFSTQGANFCGQYKDKSRRLLALSSSAIH